MLQAIRLRRHRNKNLQEPLVKKEGRTLRGIFRTKSKAVYVTPTAELPSLAPAITFTLSEDERNASNTSIEKQVVEQESTSLTFTQEQVMENALAHMRALSKKDDEIRQMQNIVAAVQQKHLQDIQDKDVELVRTKRELADTIKKLAATQSALAGKRRQTSFQEQELEMSAQELKECYLDLESMEMELRDTRQELDATRQELFVVAASLMKAQYESAAKDEDLEHLRPLAVFSKAVGDGFASFWPFGEPF